MGNPKTTSYQSPSLLPPGCWFFPSEDELLCYYLHHKNSNTRNPTFRDAIKEINLCNYSPFDLPDEISFRYRRMKRHWYCFTQSLDGGDRRRKARNGYWKRKGKVKDVMGNGGKILGTRRSFVFYLEKFEGKSDVRTDWIMFEYAVVDDLKASFVVCRVFDKSHGRNNVSEHALSSCAEESAATGRLVAPASNPDEDNKTHGHHGVDRNNFFADLSTTIEKNFEFPSSLPPEYLVTSASLGGSTFTKQHLTSILEGDYIELDDLV